MNSVFDTLKAEARSREEKQANFILKRYVCCAILTSRIEPLYRKAETDKVP